MAQFRDAEAIRERFNNHPGQFIGLLESTLTGDQVASLEEALFPAPDPESRRKALEGARLVLIRAGVTQDDPAVQSLDTEIARVPADTRPA